MAEPGQHSTSGVPAQSRTPKPSVSAFGDLHSINEVWDESDGSFSHCEFFLLTKDYEAFFGRSPKQKSDLTLQHISERLERIPDHDLFPKATASIKRYNRAVTDDVYVKLPKFSLYEDGDWMARLCAGEVAIWEKLERHPHPNVAKYHGVLVRRDRIVGIVLDRYGIDLLQRIEAEKPEDFDQGRCMRAIESAIKHLHSLGLAHNDLNPSNIMMDDTDVPHLIDFGSCRPHGDGLMTGGTDGWTDQEVTVSDVKHDETALLKVEEWMKDKLSN